MSCGLDPDAFWSKTPRYISTILGGKEQQFRREHNERAWLSHTLATLGRVKKIPDLKRLTMRDPAQRKAQTPDQQWAIFSAMAEAQKVIRKH